MNASPWISMAQEPGRACWVGPPGPGWTRRTAGKPGHAQVRGAVRTRAVPAPPGARRDTQGKCRARAICAANRQHPLFVSFAPRPRTCTKIWHEACKLASDAIPGKISHTMWAASNPDSAMRINLPSQYPHVAHEAVRPLEQRDPECAIIDYNVECAHEYGGRAGG